MAQSHQEQQTQTACHLLEVNQSHQEQQTKCHLPEVNQSAEQQTECHLLDMNQPADWCQGASEQSISQVVRESSTVHIRWDTIIHCAVK